ncbi:MAG TPA: NAD-dependent epimerase/dehydratase family protein [Candidatus Dormibacteraeota bacterium]|nr:NAD-dependent epimerase/dehydratase family protein [Candidatus Dormibacteraeota bacterium]
MRIFLTGASGFVGNHVLRALVAAGYEVRALVRAVPLPRFVDLAGAELVTGDLERPGELTGALLGCSALVHVAARYSFAPAERAALHRVNVVGTAGLLEAARLAGVERAVMTSSSAAVGPAHDGAGRPATEADWDAVPDGSAYHRSKVEQERAALAAQLPVVRVLPTAPVGPGDWKPTPTGQLVLDFLRGRMVVRPPAGGLNLVPVEDVARGHVLALARGRPGERYLLAGENLTLDAVWDLLAGICGRRVPRLRIPYAAALGLALADEARCRIWRRARPGVPLEGVRMSRHLMYADGSRAAEELGLGPVGPVAAALERAVAWYRANGFAR